MNDVVSPKDIQSSSRTNYLYLPESYDYASEIESLWIQNAILKRATKALTAQLELIMEAPQKIINVRNLPFNEVKEEVLELIQRKESIFYSEISNELKLSIEDVVKACEELEKEGKIQGID